PTETRKSRSHSAGPAKKGKRKRSSKKRSSSAKSAKREVDILSPAAMENQVQQVHVATYTEHSMLSADEDSPSSPEDDTYDDSDILNSTGKKRKRPHIFESNPSIRKRQQTRLLRKLRATLDEYTTRVGQQAIVLCISPSKPNAVFKVFGAAPLENVVRKYKSMILEDLENALAEHAPPPPELGPELPPLTIDGIPVSVDKMTQVIGWAILFPPPACQQVSWTQALRTIVKNCYKQHGREDLLYAFEDQQVSQQHVATTATHSIAHLVPSQTVVQTISNPDGTVSLIQAGAAAGLGLGVGRGGGWGGGGRGLGLCCGWAGARLGCGWAGARLGLGLGAAAGLGLGWAAAGLGLGWGWGCAAAGLGLGWGWAVAGTGLRLGLGWGWGWMFWAGVGTGATVATLADASELPATVTVAQVNYSTVTDGEVEQNWATLQGGEMTIQTTQASEATQAVASLAEAAVAASQEIQQGATVTMALNSEAAAHAVATLAEATLQGGGQIVLAGETAAAVGALTGVQDASGLVQIPVSMYQTVVTSLAQGNRPVQVAMAPVATRIDNTVTLDGQAVEVVTLEQ
ncbi:hypothetical protein JZ751_005802, partial [Albula glossodonta]